MIKSIDVDWDCPKDIRRAVRKLQNRRRKVLQNKGYNEVFFANDRYHLEYLDNAVGAFYNHIKMNETSGNYYVYFHCNPMEPIQLKSKDYKHYFLYSKFNALKYMPFYVGKGIGNRYANFNRNDSHRKIRTRIIKEGLEIDAVKIIKGISEETALEYENFFIYTLGLKALSKTGVLCNLAENDNTRVKQHLQENSSMKKN